MSTTYSEIQGLLRLLLKKGNIKKENWAQKCKFMY